MRNQEFARGLTVGEIGPVQQPEAGTGTSETCSPESAHHTANVFPGENRGAQSVHASPSCPLSTEKQLWESPWGIHAHTSGIIGLAI